MTAQLATRVTHRTWGLDDRGEDWRARAACYGHDPELWFPVGSSGPAMVQQERAKAICRRCPDRVREQCLAFALEHGAYGVWGGLSERQRDRLRRGVA